VSGKGGAAAAGAGKNACCWVSEILEEAGIDRERAQKLRRQLLEGVVLMCQWQLQRMQEQPPAAEPAARRARRGRKIQVD
jgi:hypothetical protein